MKNSFEKTILHKEWKFSNRKILADDSRSVCKRWLQLTKMSQVKERYFPTDSVATVGNWLVREYFWRRDQEATREKQEKRNTEDLTYSRYVWCAAFERSFVGQRLRDSKSRLIAKQPSLTPTLQTDAATAATTAPF